MTTGKVLIAPRITTSASVSPVAAGGVPQALRIAAAVLERERIDRQHLRSNLATSLRIQQQIDAGARFQALVMTALGTDVAVARQIGRIEDRFARRALAPQAFRQRRLARHTSVIALDFWRQQFVQPAHVVPL
jgi:hypothetical protein